MKSLAERQTDLKVVMLAHTPNPIDLIYRACRQCYSEDWAGSMILTPNKWGECKETDLIRKVISSGHMSVTEHVSFTFAIAGISKVLSHQLVRTRIASYSQSSQRYVKANEFSFIIPRNIEKHDKAREKFLEVIEYLGNAYDEIREYLVESGHEKTANEDARFVLPNATETKIVVTMNCSSLLHFLSKRCCNRAQWEIRALAQAMLIEARKVIPVVFENAGAPCETLKYCPEDAKFSCGRYPLKGM